MEKAWLQKDFSGFELTNYVLKNLKQYSLTVSEKLILLYLTSFYNAQRRLINPKISTISENIGVSKRTILRAIEKMCELEYIQKFKNGKNSSYVLTSGILVNGEIIGAKMSPIDDNRCQNVTYIGAKMSPEKNFENPDKEQENTKKNEREQIIGTESNEEDKSSSCVLKNFERAKNWGVFDNFYLHIQEEDLGLLLDFVETKKPENKGAYLAKILKTNYKEVLNELKEKKESAAQKKQKQEEREKQAYKQFQERENSKNKDPYENFTFEAAKDYYNSAKQWMQSHKFESSLVIQKLISKFPNITTSF